MEMLIKIFRVSFLGHFFRDMSFEKTLKGQKLPFAKLERFWKMSLSSGLGLRVRPSIEFTLNRRLPFFIVLESSSGYRKNIPIQSTLVLFFCGGE